MSLRVRPSTLAAPAIAAAIALAPALARADGDPDLDWWTIHTKHFNIHYAKSYEPVADRIATLAEGIYGRLTPSLGYAPSRATEIVLTDDTDLANGSATALPLNTIRLFVTAPDDISPLGDYDDWYLELVTHEFTHILHTDNISGVPSLINAIIGKTYSPNQAQPRWILEGLAVLKESEHSSGGRLRSASWDMFLRADVLEDNIATLDQVSSGAYRWPNGNIWYLYGSRFLRWISDVYGPNAMRAMSADYGATLAPWGLNRAIRRQTGRTYEELYVGFVDYLKRNYAAQMKVVEDRGLREGKRLTFHGREVRYPRFVPRAAREDDAEQIVYWRDDDNARAGLYEVPTAPQPYGAVPDEELIARIGGSVGSATWAPNGDLYFNSTGIYKNLYPRNDLFRLPKGKTAPNGDESYRKRLTEGWRAIAPDVAPDGKHIAFTVNNKGTTYLEIADITSEGAIVNKRDLVPSRRFDQVFTPRFSHDGTKLVYSAWSSGYRDVRLVDVATGKYEEITHDRALDLDPIFSPDDKTIYFASDRTGILNIYAYDIATKHLAQVTNVRTGALMPSVNESGTTLAYVGYTKSGYDLFVMPIDRSRFLEALDAPDDRPDPPEEPAEVLRRKTHYSAFPTLFPHKWFFTYKPSNYGGNALTVTASSSDVVGLNTISAQLIADPRAPSPQLVIDYQYDRLPFDFGGRFFHTVVPRTGYRVNNENLAYDEYNTGITTGIQYSDRNEFSYQGVGLSLSVAHFKGDLPVARFVDPYNTVTFNPPEGNLNVVHIGYGYSNTEGGLDAAGPVRGVAFGFGIDYGSPFVGSQYTVRALEGSFNAYFEMPWGHHTLALRTSGGVSSGEYPRGSSYSVGGYDLGNNSFASTILSGIFNGAFVLRGYPPYVYSGSEYLLQNIEYRIPLWKPDHGYSTLPVYLRRVDFNWFLDYGGAFEKLNVKDIKLFHDGYLIDAPDFHTSIGGELWLGLTLGYGLSPQLRIGVAHGFSADAYSPVHVYFVASTAY